MSHQTYYKLLAKELPAPYASFNWQTKGFNKAARKLQVQAISDGRLDEEDACARTFNRLIVRDAFAVDESSRTVYILEVVETNDIDNRKASRISDVFWQLDRAEWTLAVLVFYSAQARTVAVDPFFLDGIASRLKDGPAPYRQAFAILKTGIPERVAA